MNTNRREFLAASSLVVLSAGCAGPGHDDSSAGPIDIGVVADYPKPGVYTNYLGSNKLLIVRNKERLYASTAICTHRGCTLTFKESVFRCPCHGSVFNIDGRPNVGPATEPLDRFAIYVDDWGRLVVDKAHKYPQAEWNNPSSFIGFKKGPSSQPM